MKKKSLAGGIFLLLFSLITKAQPFYHLGSGFNMPGGAGVRSLFADTTCNCVYIGGDNLINDGIGYASHLCKWDGMTLDTTGQLIFGFIQTIEKYNNSIYSGGAFSMILQPPYNPNLAVLTGNNLLIPFGQTMTLQEEVLLLKKIDSDLFIGGGFDSIAGVAVQSMIKYDGTNWITLPKIYPNITASGVVQVVACEKYKGILYAGGNWDDSGNPGYKEDIAKLDTNTNAWVQMAQGLSGSLSFVTDMVVYKGELYIAGNICTCYGDPGNGIIKWNGTAFSPVGLGTDPPDATIWKLHIFDDKLWAVGEFTGMGGQPASHVAYWDSTQWHSIANAYFDNTIGAITSLGNDLYLGGGFWTVNGDSVYYVVRYNPTTGIEKIDANKSDVRIYPNPAKDEVTVKSQESGVGGIEIENVVGEKVISLKTPNTKLSASGQIQQGEQIKIDVSKLVSGIYFVKVTTDRGGVVRKFVKN